MVKKVLLFFLAGARMEVMLWKPCIHWGCDAPEAHAHKGLRVALKGITVFMLAVRNLRNPRFHWVAVHRKPGCAVVGFGMLLHPTSLPALRCCRVFGGGAAPPCRNRPGYACLWPIAFDLAFDLLLILRQGLMPEGARPKGSIACDESPVPGTGRRRWFAFEVLICVTNQTKARSNSV